MFSIRGRRLKFAPMHVRRDGNRRAALRAGSPLRVEALEGRALPSAAALPYSVPVIIRVDENPFYLSFTLRIDFEFVSAPTLAPPAPQSSALRLANSGNSQQA